MDNDKQDLIRIPQFPRTTTDDYQHHANSQHLPTQADQLSHPALSNLGPSHENALNTISRPHGFRLSPAAGFSNKRPTISLTDLPNEILQHLTSFLPISAAAALACCSHSTLHAIGTQYWDYLRLEHHRTERMLFLASKAPNLREYRLCNNCATFHVRDSSEGPKHRLPSHKQERPCVGKEGCISYLADGYVLKHHHIQLAMRYHDLGPAYGIPPKAFTYHHTYTFIDGSTMRTDITVEEMTGNWEFELRVDYRIRIPPGVDLRTSPWRYATRPCPHQRAFLPGSQNSPETNILSQLLTCSSKHPLSHSCSKCTALKRCIYCPTEIQARIKDLGRKGTTIEISVLKNLGRGDDPRLFVWHSQVGRAQGEPRAGSFESFEDIFDSLDRVFASFDRMADRLDGITRVATNTLSALQANQALVNASGVST